MEVGQSFMPGAGDAQLNRARISRESRHRVAIDRGQGRAIEGGDHRQRFAIGQLVLNPNLADIVILPVGEEADAVGAAHDGVKVLHHLGKGHVFIDFLLHQIGRLDVKRHLGDNTQATQPHDRAQKGLAIAFTGEGDHFAVGGDQFQAGNGGCQVAVTVAGAVGGGGDGAGNGDVRQRCHVVNGIAGLIQPGAKLNIRAAAIDRHRFTLVIKDQRRGQLIQ